MAKELDYHAKLLIYGLPELQKKEVTRTVKWLRKIADELENEDKKAFSKTFTARLMK